ncbi:MAG: PIG-L family deacetylase [Kineosporiaceae bacterium]|nr:PIG-L family deacetylase [Kineosporiaceae bacterium]MBK8076009.1 PIG-L family deacetylase [Kineosporiaceae bacterium]
MPPLNDVTRVLCVAAHPDDLDFGAAGTIAGWVDAGIEVTYLLCTRGEQGGFDDTPREAMPALREKEQRDAAAAVGVHDVRFLDGYRDGWLEPTHELQRDIVRVIRQVRPDRVLMPSPERNWARIGASHPDHLAAGEATIRAIYPAARNPFAHPELLDDEGLQPWTVREAWLMADPAADHPVRIDDTFERKLAALRAHVSQTSHHEDLTGMLTEWGRRIAGMFDLPQGALAEAFRVVETG